jgi:hypothetical protein
MIRRLGLVILGGAFFGCLAMAAITNTPAVDSVQLAAFMGKWKANQSGFQYPDRPEDVPLIIAALAKDPDARWAGYLERSVASSIWDLQNLRGLAHEQGAAKIVPTLLESDRIITAVVKTNPTNTFDLAYSNIILQEYLSQLLLASGSAYLSESRVQAQRILAFHRSATNAWSHGHLVYVANELLGHVALHEGNLADARNYLRIAGKAQLSPDSYGPDHQLAHELLNHGEPADREAVLAYLTDLIDYYNGMVIKNPLAKKVAEKNLKALARIKEAIRTEEPPEKIQWF